MEIICSVMGDKVMQIKNNYQLEWEITNPVRNDGR